jgi:hypothetical protein
MNEHLVVAGHGSVDPFALAVDRNDAVRRHLLEADAGRLHQKAPVVARQTQGHVSGDVIALVLAHEHAARIDKFFAQSVGHVRQARSSPPVVAAYGHPYIEFPADTTGRR